ncbi:MAG: 23S rRNA (adenine(1618)-N(6))-methyltransferase RlmF [Bacteroidetes bacterium]|jgi:23S rRNA (adenine1618-N6)-methyltransferase|nr:23S rRNA (adenine(1618)-N(6))-methyltransferase RlmF [Bacteroidota bacterium]
MPQNQKSTTSPSSTKSKLHPRNRNKNKYDFKKLIAENPALKNYVAKNKYGVETIDFFNADAVKLLNQALLKKDYGIYHWDIPQDFLCPPIPGRADYIHHIADLLSSDNDERIPRGPRVKALDIGTGANCIYPIIGCVEYDWDFVAADINPKSIQIATAITKANKLAIEVRQQPNPSNIFKGIINDGEHFDITVCNPPFHASAEEAVKANMRKVKNLTKGKATDSKGNKPKVAVSFGGQNTELWCVGGEIRFVRDMIKESALYKKNVLWYSTLVSKEGNLKDIYESLRNVKAQQVKTIDMGQGNKSSRVVAWSYYTAKERKQWRRGE